MPDWQERITRDTEPAIRVEHELRYQLAAPLIRDASVWADLGCGTGVAARRALGGQAPRRAILVDLDAATVETARRELGADTEGIVADLASPDGVARVRAALLEHAGDGGAVVTCFETIEHLATFVPLVELLVELAERHAVTVVASVPNDEFWSIENPHHRTMWGDGAFEELRRLLPDDVVVAHQLSLQGSAIALDGASDAARPVETEIRGGGVPTHYLAAFGPGADRIAPGARVAQVDLDDQRRWVRQREADLVHVQGMAAEFADWRSYIHELEAKLGLPLSGVDAGGGEQAAANGDEADRPAETRARG